MGWVTEMSELDVQKLVKFYEIRNGGQINWRGDWAKACDFHGKDMGEESEVPSEQCWSRCQQKTGCTHFTWTSDWENIGTCRFKHGNVSKSYAVYTGNKNVLCGISVGSAGDEKIQWNGDWANACDFYGQDMSEVRISSDKCWYACKITQHCTHFTWSTYKTGTCWLKYGAVTKADAFYNGDPNVVCGVVSA